MRRSRLNGDLGYVVLAGTVSLVGAIFVLKLWRADLGVPFEYYGDVNLQHLLVRSVLDQPAGTSRTPHSVLRGPSSSTTTRC